MFYIKDVLMCGTGGGSLWKDRNMKEHTGDTERGCHHLRGQRTSKLAFSESLPGCLVETSPQSLTRTMFPFLVDLFEGEYFFKL